MSDYIKKWREGKRAAGLCYRCGKRPAAQKSKQCEECLQGSRARSAVARELAVKEGRCTLCRKRPARQGLLTCDVCAAQQRERGKKRQAVLAKNGICHRCDAPAEPGRRSCKKHLRTQTEAENKRRGRNRSLGLCPQCGAREPTKGYSRCSVCRSKSAKNARDKRAAAVCALTGRASVAKRPWPIDTSRLNSAPGNTVDDAHILPKRRCSKEEDLDPNNHLWLAVEAHRLFDGGWITFAHNGRCLVDENLEPSIAKDYVGKRLSGHTFGNDRYMKRHRAWCIGNGFRSLL